MLGAATSFFVRSVNRWMPDSFVIAICLTILTFILAITVAGASPTTALTAWGDGFWDLLTFTNQIVLTLIFGHALAQTGPVNRLIRRIASIPGSPTGAYLLVAFTSGVTALFSWGFSLVAGAILARFTGEECKRRGIKVHYPLLVACGFSGFVIWHQGLSSSIGLAIATPGHFLEDKIGVITLSETLFTPWNIATALFVLITLPLLMMRLHPRDEERTEIPDALLGSNNAEKEQSATSEFTEPDSPASKMEQARFLNWVILGAGIVYLLIQFVGKGTGLNINLLNFAFLMLGLALASSPVHFVNLIIDAAKVAAPFLLQYPFYAGIAGMMAMTGLAEMVVNGFVAVAGPQTMPIWTFLSSGLLNLFIPSGGGQWAVQGPIVVDAAQAIGADVPKVALSVMLGDQWTNLIHPLVTIPVAAIAGLHVRQILGYCVTALIFTGVVFISALMLI